MQRTLPLLLLPLLTTPCAAQTLHAGASAAGMLVRVDPIAGGAPRDGAYLTQPVLFAGAATAGGALALHAMVNLEGLTLADGELAPGAWGEGFIDKRHPHTWLHELAATLRAGAGPVTASLTAGRGFAPFGTDDPMSRPFLRFPSNHHLAQVPERLVLIGALAAGPAVLEAGLFNGDEPTSATSLGSLDRFGDSFAARLTLRPRDGLELQASRASIESPEVAFGGGADQRKWSASARWEQALGDVALTAFGEWARTTDEDRGVALYAFRAWLLELDARTGPWRAALRYEDATRPEEERTTDRFRSPRPHTDLHLLGITRWRTVVAHVEWRAPLERLRVAPFLEAGRSYVDERTGGILQPETFYGSDVILAGALGVRVGFGRAHGRMGRYGVAALPSEDSLEHVEHR